MERQKIPNPNSLEERIRKQMRIVEKKKEEYEKAKNKLEELHLMKKRRRDCLKKRIQA